MAAKPVSDFFAGSTIFMTGATGFMGCVTLEKLLRTCDDIERIYVLLRPKKEKDTAKRLDILLESKVFERLTKEQPAVLKKIVVVPGDCGLPGLGLLPEDKERLLKECSVILHWAATVKFDENLKVATNINVRAVRDLIHMARQMPNLKSFLHVSTAFSFCVHSTIDEVFYGTPVSGNQLIQMMEALDAKTAADVTQPLLGRWPNTYVYTKAIAESLIKEEARGLPIGILRPSIVLGSYRDPVPGWVDNYYGATGILLGCAIGLIRVVYADLSCTAEMVPADYAVNAAICALPQIQRKHAQIEDFKAAKAEEVIPVYNFVSSAQKGITWEIFMELANKYCIKIPSPKIIWHSWHIFTANEQLYRVLALLLHKLPSYLIDLAAVCLGRKPIFVKAYKKIHKFSLLLSYFSKQSWKFYNTNTQLLWMQLTDADKVTFNFNMGAFDWNDFFETYVLGARLYLLKDPLETIPEGRRKYWKMRILHYAVAGLLIYVLYKFVYLMLYLAYAK